jgi:hypothetical protein
MGVLTEKKWFDPNPQTHKLLNIDMFPRFSGEMSPRFGKRASNSTRLIEEAKRTREVKNSTLEC